MKKIKIFLLTVLLIACSQSFSYADGKASEGTWVQDAFTASDTFLKEDTVDTIGISKVFTLFKNMIKTANKVLIVALAGLAIIALAITGVKYIVGGANPNAQEEAKGSLKTIFIGMVIGFGAFTIWKIAVSIINIIIGTFAQG